MKIMHAIRTLSTFALITTVLLKPSDISGAGWDTNFDTSPPLWSSENISDIDTLGNSVYVAVNGYSSAPYGRIIKYSGSTWSDVPNSKISGGRIYTISAVEISGSGDYIFVGGDFSQVDTFVWANNIAVLTLGTNPSWSPLISGGINGTDDIVTSLFAFEWLNVSPYPPKAMVYVGGYFTDAGNITSPCIARWSGLGYSGSGWEAVGGGVDNVAGVFGRNVNAIDVSYSNMTGFTRIAAVFLAGAFEKTTSGGTTHNIAIYSHITGSWLWIGSGLGTFIQSSWPDCTPGWATYPSFYGYSVAMFGSVYFGGFFQCTSGVYGDLDYLLIPDYLQQNPCGNNGPYQVAVSKYSNQILQLVDPEDLLGQAWDLSKHGNSLYAGGEFQTTTDSTYFYAAKLNNGNWQPLPNISGPSTHVFNTTTDSTSVYFTTDKNVYRYVP